MLPLVSTRPVPRPAKALGSPCEKLTADCVAHVVGQERETFGTDGGDVSADDVGMQLDRVPDIGLLGEAESGQVQEQDPSAWSQACLQPSRKS